tara:strand:- start:5119 stop:7356 length:2238 start_codon:yes stop_codon:yes gene_type:complete
MKKLLFKIFITLLIFFIFIVIYLSYFGIETSKFDALIKNKANEVNKKIKLDFNKTRIHLSISEQNLALKLQKPKLILKSEEINLSKLDIYLSIKSFFSSDFALKKAEVSFVRNDIKDITKVTNIFLPKFINRQLNKIFAEGNLEGEFLIPFKADGNIDENYTFSGKISDALINLTDKFSIKNLTTTINHSRVDSNDRFKIKIEKGLVNKVDLANSIILFIRENDVIKFENIIHTNGKLTFSDIKKISKIAGININNFENINGSVDLKSKINFKLNKQFRIKNLLYSTEGNINYAEIHTKSKKIIKNYLPDYNPVITLKDSRVKFTKSKSNRVIELNGSRKVKDYFDSFEIKETYNYNKKNSQLTGKINLTNSKIIISRLNYSKDQGIKSELSFDITSVINKYYNINKINFYADKNKIILSGIKLNNNFEVNDFKKLEITTYNGKIKNNDFSAKKERSVTVSGEVFDAQHLLKGLYKKRDKKTFSNDFNTEIKVNFNKALTGTNDDVKNFAMISSIKKGSYEKLSLKGNFSQDEIIEMSIYQLDKDKKTLQVISDRARPFIKNFDFIKGFEGGKLEYESVISDKISNSNLLITNFKVSKVPALAQLLTLASLQGIADTLGGEGIRFDSFEMKTNSKDNVLNIEDALAMGPAVSILLSGYVDKGKIISLRGTLVPATKLNAIIASIPLVGDILVGKKTGEGVVGVSFKMKGPPKDIKTTVNPIKTLTPRFIVRAVEKMKKKKSEEPK